MTTRGASLSDQLGIDGLLSDHRYQAALDRLIPVLYPGGPEGQEVPRLSPEAEALRDRVFAALREYLSAATHPPRTRMKFGTSGWRGLYGEDFTVANVMRVTQALLDVLLGLAPGYEPPLGPLGVADVAEIRRRGCVLAHDTRFMSEEFAAAVARVLLAHEVPVIYLGMATTPEVSTALYEARAAFSINLTPSHNPYFYHGYKFNPSDGGPATAELTGPVTRRANEIFDQGLPVRALSEAELLRAQDDPARFRRADPVDLYKRSLLARFPALDLRRICEGINHLGLELFIDNAYGATIGKYQRLLDEADPRRLHVLHGTPDPLFGGQSREPSEASFRELQRAMTGGGLTLGIINDGDGDRFMGGGRRAVLPMNRFGPLVVRYLTVRHGMRGDVTRSLMTSHMADAARRRYQPQGQLHETRVGFQYIKPYIATSVNSWEESDGMSPMGWSLDKDGMMAALLLCAMVIDLGRTPEELDADLTAELGTFCFERRKVAGRLSGEPLAEAIRGRLGRLTPGVLVEVPGLPALRVERVEILDGVKVVLHDGWWVGVRASGTEPAARIYVETGCPPGAPATSVEAAREALGRLHEWARGELEAAVG